MPGSTILYINSNEARHLTMLHHQPLLFVLIIFISNANMGENYENSKNVYELLSSQLNTTLMHYKLFNTLLFLFFLLNAFSQQKKIVQKPVYRPTVKPSFNVKDDPSPIKYIQLKKDTPVYIPQNFYIQKIVDNTNSADSIGFILQPKSGKKQRISFTNGTVQGLEEYFNFKIAKDTTLYPLVFTLKNISLSEEKENDYRNGIFRYAYSFEYMYKDKPLTIGGADGRFTYKTHVTQDRLLDSNITNSLTHNISEVENNLKEAMETHPAFCKGVNTFVTLSTHNSYTSDTLFFDGQQELMWDDFTSGSAGADNFFLPLIGLLFDPEIKYEKGKVQLQIITGAYFIKSVSWVGKKVKTPQLLSHLQYRFKIAGLAALKLKKKIETSTFSCSNYETEIRDLILNSNKQLQLTFEEYSNQTITGSNKKEQTRWQELIENELSAYEKIK